MTIYNYITWCVWIVAIMLSNELHLNSFTVPIRLIASLRYSSVTKYILSLFQDQPQVCIAIMYYVILLQVRLIGMMTGIGVLT